jgi:peptidoglycan/LPS O-acetylase OafA/YrhL
VNITNEQVFSKSGAGSVCAVPQDVHAVRPQSQFFPSVHYLRGIAALLVVFEHVVGRGPFAGFNSLFGWLDNRGHYGVVAFFVISGFVLPLSLGQTYGLRSFPRFFARRLIRIEPTYFASIAVTCAVVMLLTRAAPNSQPWHPTLKQLALHAFYLVPFSNVEWINGIYWTLAIEFQFYVVIGLLYPLLRYATTKSLWLGMLFCVSFALMSFLAPFCPNAELLRYTPYFALGMVCCISIKFRRDFAAISAAVSALTVIQWASGHAPPNVAGGRMGAWCAGLIAVSAILFWKPRGEPRSLSARAFWLLGTISYSLYVVHQIIASTSEPAGRYILNRWHGAAATGFANCVPALALIASIAAAWLLYLVVEKPSHRWAKSLKL